MISTVTLNLLIILFNATDISVNASNPNAPGYVLLGISLISGLLSASGVGLWMKIKNDRLRGIREDDRKDDEAVDARIEAAMQRQEKYVIQPMNESIASLRETVRLQGEDITYLKTRYRIAIDYIKVLMAFFKTEAPEYHHVIPKPPPEIEDELR